MSKLFTLFVPLVLFAACKQRVDYQQYQHSETNTEEQLVSANRALVKKDQKVIEGVAKRNNWTMHETTTGLWYEILEEGVGDTAKEGQIITLKYTLTLLDGTACYSSEKNGDKVFEIGRGGVESGLEQAVLMCQKGTKARFVLPPYMAHGLPGDNNKIPSRAIIVYNVEVINLTNKN